MSREAGQRAEVAGGDHEPAAAAQQWAEGADHPGGAEVVGVDQVVHLFGEGNPGDDRGGGVRIHEIQATRSSVVRAGQSATNTS